MTNPTEAFLRSFRVVPIETDGHTLALGMENPADDYAAEAMALWSDKPVLRVLMSAQDIDDAIERLALPEGSVPEDFEGPSSTEEVDRLRDLASDAPGFRQRSRQPRFRAFPGPGIMSAGDWSGAVEVCRVRRNGGL